MSNTPTKRCRICGVEYPVTPEYFYPRKSAKDGLRTECRACRLASSRAYYEAHAEERRQYAKEYAVHHRDERREYARQWRKANPAKVQEHNRKYMAKHKDWHNATVRRWYYANREARLRQTAAYAKAHPEQTNRYQATYRKSEKYRATRKRYYVANKERIAANGRVWVTQHPELHRARIHRYRTRKIAAVGSHTAEDIQAQLRSQQGKCWWCGCDLDTTYHVDHVIPLSRGGSDAPDNLVIACARCNLSKGARLPHEWNGRLL